MAQSNVHGSPQHAIHEAIPWFKAALPTAHSSTLHTISLSMLVLNSMDRHEKYGFLKNVSRKQPDNNVFLQNTAVKSIGTMLLGP